MAHAMRNTMSIMHYALEVLPVPEDVVLNENNHCWYQCGEQSGHAERETRLHVVFS